MNKKVVLVTGASSGIGRSISLALVREGYTVHGCCRSAASYPDITEYKLHSMDVTKPEQIRWVLNELIEESGRLDVLVNNAGKGITGPIETTPVEEMERVFDLNVYGPVRVIQEALPHMRRLGNGGTVINISSIAGYMGLPFRGVYSASKSALNMITESLRLECSQSDIRFCTVDPGDFATEIGQRRYHTPNPPDSPYYQTYGRIIESIDDDVKEGTSPDILADALVRLLRKKTLKPHYRIGKPLQVFSITLKGILPSKVYEGLLRNHYKL